jgi:hypothetical protein
MIIVLSTLMVKDEPDCCTVKTLQGGGANRPRNRR